MKIEEYKDLLLIMHYICDQMPNIIFNKYFDANKYLFSIYFDSYNSIKGFCVLVDNGSLISQACAVLRMALEQTAIVRIIELHKELLPKYIEHKRTRFELLEKKNNERKNIIKEHYKEEIEKNDNPIDFLEYGWYKPISSNYSFDTLIKLSQLEKTGEALNKWKNILNYWVHGSIDHIYLLHDPNLAVKYIHDLVSISALLLDNLICDFHNETQFNFIFNEINYRDKFIEAYKKSIE